MPVKTIFMTFWIAQAVCFPVGALAGPKILVDTMEVNVGTIHEQETKILTHTFAIKNTGDSPVGIYNIRPGCGCTKVTNDSVIEPGKIGHITMSVDVSEFHNGNFFAYVKVSTTDNNCPRFQIGLSGVLKLLITVDAGAIVLPTIDKKDTACTVTLFAKKNDLQVTAVSFIMDNPPFEWLAKIPIRFKFEKTGKKNNEGLWAYTLQVFHPLKLKETSYGKFIVSTNHPDKPTFKIAGELDPIH